MMYTSAYHLPYDPDLVDLAIELRKNMTPQEKDLWFNFFRFNKIKFYRQRPIYRYIVDFYCPAFKLVIEIDGNQHLTQEGCEADADRDMNLKGLGLKVLRFTNYQIDNDFTIVCNTIESVLNIDN